MSNAVNPNEEQGTTVRETQDSAPDTSGHSDRANADLALHRSPLWTKWSKDLPFLKRPFCVNALITRARIRDATLTDDERQQLLNLPDMEDPVLGKALAYPDTLTEEEKIRVLRWPPEEIRRANIAQVTNGSNMTLEEFLDRAATDIGFLNYDRIMLILNDYNIPPQDPDWNYQKPKEREDAQLLFMPELETKAYKNAKTALQGEGVAVQVRRLLAGELNAKDAAEERGKLLLYKRRYEELVWVREVWRAEITFVKPGNVRSEEDIYLKYFTGEDAKLLQDFVSEEGETTLVFYKTTELRATHAEEAEKFRTGKGGGFKGNVDFALRLAIEHSLSEGDHERVARLREQGVKALPTGYWPPDEITVSFEFFWQEYLTMMLGPRTNVKHMPLAFYGALGKESNLPKRIRYHASEFEASEKNLHLFRQHFRALRETPSPEKKMLGQCFFLCSPDVTPPIGVAGGGGLTAGHFVWVVDADWEPTPGKDADDDGYQGKLKSNFRRNLFLRLIPKLLIQEGFKLKDAWLEMREHGWDVRY